MSVFKDKHSTSSCLDTNFDDPVRMIWFVVRCACLGVSLSDLFFDYSHAVLNWSFINNFQF